MIDETPVDFRERGDAAKINVFLWLATNNTKVGEAPEKWETLADDLYYLGILCKEHAKHIKQGKFDENKGSS